MLIPYTSERLRSLLPAKALLHGAAESLERDWDRMVVL